MEENLSLKGKEKKGKTEPAQGWDSLLLNGIYRSVRSDVLLVLIGKHKKTHEKGRGPSSMGAGWKSPAELNLVGLGKPSFPKRRVAPAQGPD